MKHERFDTWEVRQRFPYLGDFMYNRGDAGEESSIAAPTNKKTPRDTRGPRRRDGRVGRARVVILEMDSWRTVLVMNQWAQDSFKFPGGGIRPGETPAETAAREGYEETGISLDPDELIPIGNEGNDHFFLGWISKKEMDGQFGSKQYGDQGEMIYMFLWNQLLQEWFLTSEPSRVQPPLFRDNRIIVECLCEYFAKSGMPLSPPEANAENVELETAQAA